VGHRRRGADRRCIAWHRLSPECLVAFRSVPRLIGQPGQDDDLLGGGLRLRQRSAKGGNRPSRAREFVRRRYERPQRGRLPERFDKVPGRLFQCRLLVLSRAGCLVKMGMARGLLCRHSPYARHTAGRSSWTEMPAPLVWTAMFAANRLCAVGESSAAFPQGVFAEPGTPGDPKDLRSSMHMHFASGRRFARQVPITIHRSRRLTKGRVYRFF
jgi:hypothetical protein